MVSKNLDQIVSVHDIVKSESDRRLYRGLTLKNGLRVLLVSDPTTDKSAIALSVQVGSLTDPQGIPGLAHFLEHMLFLGTKKYPGENDYAAFLASHGGYSNAFTGPDATCYYHDVMPDHFEEANDIFAQFFIEPLFTESGTDRELLAVDNEHRINLKIDQWRLWRLLQATGDSLHDFCKFGTGSKETLQEDLRKENIDLRTALLEFHSKYYSSNIMNLCILGKESLDRLQEMAVELFGGVVNKNIKAPEWPQHPYGEAQLKKLVKVVPVEDSIRMIMMFPLPDMRKEYKAKPWNYLSHLVGHRGEGSLLSYLKSKGWVTASSCSWQPGGRGFSFFRISFELSNEGLDRTDEIAEALFQYLEMLRQHGPQKWVFEEIRKTSQTDFRFGYVGKPINFVVDCARYMQHAAWEDILSAPYTVEEYKPELIEELMSCLVPEKIRITLVSKTFEGKTNLQEKYYSTEYSIEDIQEEKIKAWENVTLNDQLHLPPVNEFIPTNFDFALEEPQHTSKPSLLIDEAGNRLWFMQDKKFKLPRSIVRFELRNPILKDSSLNRRLMSMFVRCFNDATTEYFYPASLAGLTFELDFTQEGLTIDVTAHNELKQTFLEAACAKLAAFKIDRQRFEVLREAYVRELESYGAEQPYHHAGFWLGEVLAEKVRTEGEQLDSTEHCTLENCEKFLEEFLSQASLEGLVCGNLRSEDAIKMSETVRNTLKLRELSREEPETNREHKLNSGNIYEFNAFNEVHPNNSVCTYYQVGSSENIRSVALNDLLAQILNEPCFDILRTKEQLGYMVSGSSRRRNGTVGIRVLVQSDKPSSHLVERIGNFVNNHLKQSLAEMSSEAFEEHKKALCALKLEEPKSLWEKFIELWDEIHDRSYVFNRKQLEADEIAKLTKNDVSDFFAKHVANGGPALKQLIVKVISKSNPGEEVESPKPDYVIEDLAEFKSTHSYITRPAQRTRNWWLRVFRVSRKGFQVLQNCVYALQNWFPVFQNCFYELQNWCRALQNRFYELAFEKCD